jgi:hypothetical protein
MRAEVILIYWKRPQELKYSFLEDSKRVEVALRFALSTPGFIGTTEILIGGPKCGPAYEGQHSRTI